MAARNAIPIGKKFNRLTILCEAPKRPGNANRRVSALCECGNAGTFVLSEVLLGKTRSCGCISTGRPTHGHTARKKMSPEYYSWSSMWSRCSNPRHAHWHRYGGRGISVCPEWKSFERFLSDMGSRPPGQSLDRIDGDGNYEPSNCRWATRKQQANNTRSNRYVEHDGLRLTLSQWADRTGLSVNTISARIKRFHWPPSRAVTTPPRLRSK
jgi:hypothetical protein